MSLPLIAKHLEQHGRGEDTHLVHMTTGELRAMQKLAESRGGSLTINPHTGLPEAGFLSSVLPMALGAVAAATGQEWAVPLAMAMSAGGEYAMTGSLTQGLMAGLGAWGGAGIESGLAGLGAESAVQAGGDLGQQAFDVSQAAAGAPGTPAVDFNAVNSGLNSGNFPNLSPDQLTQFQQAVPNAVNPSDIYNAAGQANASLGSNITNPTFADSLSNAGKGITSGNLGPYAMAHLGQVAAVGVPLLSGATSLFKQPTVPTATNTSTNPFGLKTIPKDANGNPIFSASLPAQPSPHYQATYPNYVQNPYNPYATATAKRGGLMDIPKYSGADYGSMVTGANEMQQGLAQATSPQQLSELQKELIAAGQQGSANGVYQLNNVEYEKLNPTNVLKAHKIAVAKGLQPVGQLGDYETTPAAAIAQADIDKAAQQKTSAKEGGLMAFSNGGSPIYHPQYQNYAQTPFNPATAQGYGGIPTPTRSAAMPATGYKMSNITGGTPGGSGAANLYSTLNNLEATAGLPLTQAPTLKPGQLDPSIMIGSPQNNALNAQISKLQAQNDAFAAYNSDGGGDGAGGGARGGLPKDFKKFAMGGGIQDGHLGSYSDGGRLLKGPGDGVSDGIPATIGGKQPARLADGEFVIPARIVSELGNGSTDAGAKRLYAMMDRIKHARKKSKDIAADTKAYKYLPA